MLQVTPVAPTLTPAVCRGGVLEPPSLKPETTDGITYSFAPAGTPGEGEAVSFPVSTTSVTVTATLRAGAWPPEIPGWTITSPTMATSVVPLNTVPCTEAIPVVPPVIPAACTGGLVTPPTVSDTGVTVGYVLTHSDLGDGTTDAVVTFFAKVLGGYAWQSPPPLPWAATEGDPAIITTTVTLVAGRCDAATPVVTFDPPECVDGVALPARVTPVIPTDGVTYEPAEAFAVPVGGTASVTATLDPEDYAWAAPEAMPGWVIGPATVATFAITSEMTVDPCVRLSPLAPVPTASRCASGELTASVLTPQGPDGVVYSFVPAPSRLVPTGRRRSRRR